MAVLGQIPLGIGIVLAGGDSRTHQILAAAHEAGAGLVWTLLIVLATRARRGESRVLSPRAEPAAPAAPAVPQ